MHGQQNIKFIIHDFIFDITLNIKPPIQVTNIPPTNEISIGQRNSVPYKTLNEIRLIGE
jgi:hypothetical protein